jgi:hypothetical protein
MHRGESAGEGIPMTNETSVRAEAGMARMRWIPVSEGLPDSWAIVVIGGHVQRIMARFDGDDWEWSDLSGDHAPKEAVTHWMPLPAATGAEGDAK